MKQHKRLANSEVNQLLRPMLFVLEGVKGVTMSNLRMLNPPNVSCATQ